MRNYQVEKFLKGKYYNKLLLLEVNRNEKVKIYLISKFFPTFNFKVSS